MKEKTDYEKRCEALGIERGQLAGNFLPQDFVEWYQEPRYVPGWDEKAKVRRLPGAHKRREDA